MSIVLDASVVVAAATASLQHTAAREHLDKWVAAAEDLHVPHLFIYEVASAVTGLEAEGQLSHRMHDDVWDLIDVLDLTFHPPSGGPALVAMARRLGRRSAYDAAYIDLALQLTAELWTLDGKLARNAASLGFPVTLAV
ncbi:MAG TPA: type II toxin-antitoxin system VapC family toxin [Candidatus Dormibacteraeota bacterium]